ncbi:MAG: hypothetical protein AUG51_21480 [Acidobacteria bacterium 13_1_20CM_3_53_8]|nr:MAG: hypothetical protein AUG51_21480 [Acidobacteria bacterium 13_1_20CM_3_53_8]
MKTSKPRPFLIWIFLPVSILILWGVSTILSSAQSNSMQSSAPHPKKLIYKIPPHIPLKVKIKNLDHEMWEDDLEIEVTNTSTKPIYLLELWLVMPEIISTAGHETGFPLRYGRIELVDFSTQIQPDDVPIQPGESYVFKLPVDRVRGWRKFKSDHNTPDPKKLRLMFVQINFGDGTGFNGTDGAPFSYQRQQSSNGSCGGARNRVLDSVSNFSRSRALNSFLQNSFSFRM